MLSGLRSFVLQAEHVLLSFIPAWLVFSQLFPSVSAFLELVFVVSVNWCPVFASWWFIYFSAFHPLYLLISHIAFRAPVCFIANHGSVFRFFILILDNVYTFNPFILVIMLLSSCNSIVSSLSYLANIFLRVLQSLIWFSLSHIHSILIVVLFPASCKFWLFSLSLYYLFLFVM